VISWQCSILCNIDVNKYIIELSIYSKAILPKLYKKRGKIMFRFNHEVHAQWVKGAEEALSTADNFKKIITSADYLCLYGRMAPSHADRLIEYVLDNPDEFNRLFPNEPVFTSVHATFPKHSDRLIEYVLTDPEIFNKLYKNEGSVIIATKLFPKYKEAFNKRFAGEDVKIETNRRPQQMHL
jgi:hypothetical protein